jgi:hypothetical protein
MITIKNSNPSQLVLKIAFLAFFLIIISSELDAQSQNNSITNKAVDGGICLGSIIAVAASWSRNKSILYAIIHGLLGWLYVIYFVLTKEHKTDTNGDDTVTDEIYNDDVYKEQKN